MHAAEFKKSHDAKGSAYFDLRLKPFSKSLNYPIFFSQLASCEGSNKSRGLHFFKIPAYGQVTRGQNMGEIDSRKGCIVPPGSSMKQKCQT